MTKRAPWSTGSSDVQGYTATLLDAPADADHQRRIELAEAEIDNLRTAFASSRESSDTDLALTLASALQLLWLTRGTSRKG